jgi:hypothetical protein
MAATTTADSAPTNALDPVKYCSEAFNAAYLAEREKGATNYDSTKIGASAYRRAMPRLTTYANIRDFIACVTHGMVCQVISNADGTKLLYASQVALTSLRAERKSDQKTT